MAEEPTPARSYWSVITGEGGKTGRYADVLGGRYVYSSTVPNHKNVREGDVLVVRSKKQVVGTGIVDSLVSWEDHIRQLRCPTCDRAKVVAREYKTPEYRCQSCRAEFSSPREAVIDGTWFEASYARHWVEFQEPPTVEKLADTYATRAGQNAIHRLDPARISDLLEKTGTVAQLHELYGTSLPTRTIRGGHVLRPAKSRIGQRDYRRELLARYGEVCAITGPCPAGALEAAHLTSFAETELHNVEAGLILRADVHRLFDGYLLTINPHDWTVRLSPQLRDHPATRDWEGRTVQLDADRRPMREPLVEHAENCRTRWGLTE